MARQGYFRHCDLAAGDHGIVSNAQYPGSKREGARDTAIRFDMRNNWWATADADSIAALIFDHNDNDDKSYIVDYQPFLNQSVSVDQRRLGDIKSMFRD
jgi:hypothetical protein